MEFFITWIAYDALTITILLAIVGTFFLLRFLYRKFKEGQAFMDMLMEAPFEVQETPVLTVEEIEAVFKQLEEEDNTVKSPTFAQDYFMSMSDVGLLNDIRHIERSMTLRPGFVHEDYQEAINEALFRGLIQ